MFEAIEGGANMLTAEERSLLAKRVMGWHEDAYMGFDIVDCGPGWFDEQDEGIMLNEYWQPDVYEEQAWDLVEAIGKMSMGARLTFMTSIYDQGLAAWPDVCGDFSSRYPDPFCWFMLIADKPAAIAAAALAVAKEIAQKEQPC